MFFDRNFCKMSLINFRSVFQHLYVLHLDMNVDNMSIVPDAIGSLYHLKLLSLRGIRDLPSSIGNLKNLQTLVVNEGEYPCKLPRETADLINLRHLVARYYSKPLVHISKLTSLQVLEGIRCDQWKDVDPVDLVNLRELSMKYIKKSYSLNNISSLKNLSRGQERTEDVAEGFLNELIRRSLVQVAYTYWDRVTKCRVHDLLRGLAIEKALEVNFFNIYDPRSHSISSLCIRHVIHSEGERYLSLDLSNLKLRSIMFFDPDLRKMSHINFRSVFQHLYVLYLDMHVGNVSIVPDAIGSLYHLKLLRLIHIRDVPSFIGNLKNLETLVVNEGAYSCKLPRETADLINLRHLVARYTKPLVHIRKLTSLQVFDGICCDQWKDVDPVDLVNLQELSMDHINKSYSLNNIRSLKNLSTLRLLCKYDGSFPSLEFVNCCEKLQILWLSGRIEKLPHLFPNSITMMLLNFSVLTEDPMPILGMLPNLRNLDLVRAYEGKEIMCSDNSFSQLEFLHLSELEKLERWHLGTSAMPLIKGLHIHACPNLKEIPERMKDVELLKRNYMR